MVVVAHGAHKNIDGYRLGVMAKRQCRIHAQWALAYLYMLA
jgi:hypothetical protein